jgi:integrase
MALTDRAARTAKNQERPYKLADSGGLYLLIHSNGARYWRMKYRVASKEKLLSIGVYPEVTLREARERRDEARRMLRDGIDPSGAKQASKRQAKLVLTSAFQIVARDWIEHQSARWEEQTKRRIVDSLEKDAFPAIGARPIADLKPADIIAVVRAIEARGAGESAARVLQRIADVFKFAVMAGRIETNPIAGLRPGDVLRPRQVQHRAALPEREVPQFLSRLDAYDGDPTTKAALQLLVLTAVRPGELRGARWDEIDTAAATWRIPAERMKMRTEHIVPLSSQSLAVIETMRSLTGDDSLVFPSPYYPGKQLSENTMNSALARMGYKGIATAHGFRSLFSTVANEYGHDPDHIERQLAHIEANKVRAAYHRAVYVKERAKLMQWWADWLDAKKKGAKVIPMRGAAA